MKIIAILLFCLIFFVLPPVRGNPAKGNTLDDPLEASFYLKEPAITQVLGKLDRLIDLGVDGVEKTTPLTDIQTKQAALETDNRWLTLEALDSRSFRKEQLEFNQSLTVTMTSLGETVVDLKGNWNIFLTAITGVITMVLGAVLTALIDRRRNGNNDRRRNGNDRRTYDNDNNNNEE